MNFIIDKFENFILNCGNGINSFINAVERNIVVSSKKHPVGKSIQDLDARICRLESLHEIIVNENDNNEKITIVHSDVKTKKNINSDDLQVRVGDNYRSVLLKSPETINDDAWVHVNNLQN